MDLVHVDLKVDKFIRYNFTKFQQQAAVIPRMDCNWGTAAIMTDSTDSTISVQVQELHISILYDMCSISISREHQ